MSPLFTERYSDDCRPENENAVRDVISSDFLFNRLLTWEKDKQLLGTDSPVMTFGQMTLNNDYAYIVPFLARGPKGKRECYGIVTCDFNDIEYSAADEEARSTPSF